MKLIKKLLASYSAAEAITEHSDYLRVKKWVKKTKTLYKIFAVLGAIFGIIMLFYTIASTNSGGSNIIEFIQIALMPILALWSSLGYATLILYFPQVFKSVAKSTIAGYSAGEKIKTTHVNVTHDYGNTYKVSAHTEDKGCLFAAISGIFQFLIWAFFCVYIGPFVTYKKIKTSIENIKNYELTSLENA